MAPMDYDDDLEDGNEKYHESSDDDFNPETAPVQEVSSSEDEDDATAKPAQRKGKRKAPADEDLDSGDEVTIQAARKKRAKKNKKGTKDTADEDVILSDDDEGGEGGLIKTRAQRRVEKKERKPLARTDGATVDVDALWAQMTAVPLQPLQPLIPQEEAHVSKPEATITNVPPPIEEEEQVTVKKVYTFAGQDTTEEKQIPRSHLDKYISDGWKTPDAPPATAHPIEENAIDTEQPAQSKIRRPLRRPTRFDPNPTGYVRALAPEHQLSWPRKGISTLRQAQENVPEFEVPKVRVEKAQKLNVVDKSRMDWSGFVDKEGIAEELDTHGKTKEAYLGRMEFLAGVEAKREEERLRMKTAAATATT
ncbi:SWR1-complex protein 5 [Cucurbitaria berberidis CBS 394.84]|uniref:SWR1-complex protein 5 n=1 Tax=Cucurbitaria berberidis CBS 394.84 TaxID=1168544 RepID=A0A9P4GEV3_9PLEO|nr:SWR1-complex protein 5 [Cucurbitaria berberidis CBS 394.84]KAF1844337.1 SWR1-complex protein 5 [Cucurbitaria berberidis CBS 394.84]